MTDYLSLLMRLTYGLGDLWVVAVFKSQIQWRAEVENPPLEVLEPLSIAGETNEEARQEKLRTGRTVLPGRGRNESGLRPGGVLRGAGQPETKPEVRSTERQTSDQGNAKLITPNSSRLPMAIFMYRRDFDVQLFLLHIP